MEIMIDDLLKALELVLRVSSGNRNNPCECPYVEVGNLDVVTEAKIAEMADELRRMRMAFLKRLVGEE